MEDHRALLIYAEEDSMDRIILDLRKGWRFHLGECEEAWYRGYDDADWREVTVPHDWSVEAPFSQDYSSGTGYLAGGTAWYRIRFLLPESCQGKRVRLIFDGVYKNSQVWCNSYYLGKRPSGYTTFSYDISEFARFGREDNEVSVKVVHTDLADSRWFTGSGITRKVSLLIEEPVHPAEYGCFFRTEKLEPDSQEAVRALVTVAHEAVNAGKEKVRLNIRTKLLDEDGRAAAEFAGGIQLDAGGSGRLTLDGCVESPCLWSPETPYLYRMQTWYSVNGGEAYLVDEQKVGVRSISFDPQEGFFLNGVKTVLKGVCVHHDGGCLGAAMQPEIWQRRLTLLKDCGCNAIRCSHNPHMPELYQLCDAMGFLVMDEAFDEWENAKNKWSTGHNVYPPRHQGYYEDFPDWHERDLRAMVRRDRNHPSVILWSIGNEIDYPNDPYCHPMFGTMTGNNDANKPEAERRFDTDKPNMERLSALASHLAGIVREEDESRPVTLAAAFPELSSRLGFLDALDVVGYNYKEHLYEEDHGRFPDKTFLGSENGHSYGAWRAVTEHPYICGQFLWTGIDYLGEAHGWPVHGSPAGILTSAGFAKPEYFRRKTFWCDEPTMHLATRKEDGREADWIPMSNSWNYEPGTQVLVKCYTQFPDDESYVALLCNGTEIGRERNRGSEGAYVFHVPYEAGMLEAQRRRPDGSILSRDCLYTTGAASGLDWQLWQERDVLSGEEWSDCSRKSGYICQILLTLRDESGRKVVWDDREVRVHVQGGGEFAGADSGNLADITPFSSDTRKTFRGELAVYVRRKGQEEVRVELELSGEAEDRKYEVRWR